MARKEQDREDLFREATALVERVELQLPGGNIVVAGFRRDGAASFFFDVEPVFQFNAAGQLRRGFADGRLWKAESGRLVALRRVRQDGAVQLLRTELGPVETTAWLQAMDARLDDLEQSLPERVVLRGQAPPEADVLERVRQWLATRPSPPGIADAPHVAGPPSQP